MSRALLLVGMGMLVASMAMAQSPGAALASGTKIDSRLKTRLDTRHAKAGDRVTAVTTADVKQHGIDVLPKGSTLIGHVTEVTRAQGSKDPSSLGVLFDQAMTKSGERIPLHAAIVSVISSSVLVVDPNAPPMQPMPIGPPSMAVGGGGLLGAAAGVGTAGGAVIGAAAGAGPVLARDAGTVDENLTAASGVRGIASNGVPVHIFLPRAGARAAQQSSLGGVLGTPRGNLQLNSGTRIQLQETGVAAGASSSASGSGGMR